MAMRQSTRLFATLGGTLVLAAAAGLYAFYGVHEAEEAKAAKEAEEARLLAVEKDAITGLVVEAKGETARLERRDGAWRLVAPVDAAADAGAVGQLVDRLAEAKRTRVIREDGAEAGKFGLDAPPVRVVAVTGAGEQAIALGATNGFDGSLYARAGEGPIVAVEGSLRYALEKTAFDLREKRVFPAEELDVRKLAVEGVASPWTVERDGDGWKLLAPLAERADRDTVHRVLGALRGLRATAFPAETGADGAPFGLASPRATVTATLEGGATVRLALGEVAAGDGRKAYARTGDGPVAEVAPKILDDVAPPVSELRDRTVLAFDREKAHRLELGGEVALALEKRRSDGAAVPTWALTAPAPGPAKGWKVSSLLTTLGSLKGVELLTERADDLAPYGLAEPARIVTIRGEDGAELARLLVGKRVDDRVHVKSAASPRVWLVEGRRIDELPGKVEDVAEAPPVPVEAAKTE